MNENPNPPSRFDQTVTAIRAIVPREWLPCYPNFPQPTIVDTLEEAVRDVPSLESLALATLKHECLIVQQTHPNRKLRQQTDSLPALPRTIQDEKLFSDHDLFLLGHDTAAPLNIVQDQIYLRHSKFIPTIKPLIHVGTVFHRLGYQYSETLYDKSDYLSYAYAKLMREYIHQAVLPVIQNTINARLPIGIFELHELRSGYRELVELDPLTWAVTLPLRATLEQFIESQTFRDKNTQKPVHVQFSNDCANPLVVIDPGDLFRMTRNLLRDAVTHGDGPTITPLIHITERDGVVEYSIYSPGQLDAKTLAIIGKQPYTTKDCGDRPHGYGKVGARKLLTALWNALGVSPRDIESLLHDHWSNTMLDGSPFVRWTAPLPIAE